MKQGYLPFFENSSTLYHNHDFSSDHEYRIFHLCRNWHGRVFLYKKKLISWKVKSVIACNFTIIVEWSHVEIFFTIGCLIIIWSGLNIKIGIAQKVYELWTMPILIFGPVYLFMRHPLGFNYQEHPWCENWEDYWFQVLFANVRCL